MRGVAAVAIQMRCAFRNEERILRFRPLTPPTVARRRSSDVLALLMLPDAPARVTSASVRYSKSAWSSSGSAVDRLCPHHFQDPGTASLPTEAALLRSAEGNRR